MRIHAKFIMDNKRVSASQYSAKAQSLSDEQGKDALRVVDVVVTVVVGGDVADVAVVASVEVKDVVGVEAVVGVDDEMVVTVVLAASVVERIPADVVTTLGIVLKAPSCAVQNDFDWALSLHELHAV